MSAIPKSLRLSLLSTVLLALPLWLAPAQQEDSKVALPRNRPRGPLRCVNGFAGPYPCLAVDQVSHVPLHLLSKEQRSTGPVVAWSDASGRVFAVAAGRVVDLTDAAAPKLLGTLGDGPFRSAVIVRSHLYALTFNLTAEQRLAIYALDRLAASSGPVEPEDSIPAPFVEGIAANDETGRLYLFFGGPFRPGRVLFYDLADPAAPREIASWNPGPSYAKNLDCVVYHGADARFAGREICFGAAPPRSLVIYDVSDESHPVKLSRTFYRRFNEPWRTALSPDHNFLFLLDTHDEYGYRRNTRVFLWDLASLTEPIQFDTFDGPTRARDHDLKVRGGRAFLGNGSAGLRVLDVSRLGSGPVRERGFFDTEIAGDDPDWAGARSLEVLPGGILLVSSERQGLYLLRPRP